MTPPKVSFEGRDLGTNQQAAKRGVKPLIGCEVYVCDDATRQEKGYAHLTLLAESNEGYGNLIKLASAGYLEGYYYKPRVDWNHLQAHAKGLVALSGCLSGRVCKASEESRPQDAASDLDRLAQVFGRANVYVEIQNAGLSEQARINPLLAQLAADSGLPLVATGDVHYLRHEDARAHEALLCIQSGDSLKNEGRWRFDTDQFYFKTPAGRDRVINYVKEKYGRDRVAQIITFGTMLARAAVRDAGRVLEIPYGQVNRIAKMIPEGPKVYLEDSLKPGAELKQAYDSEPQVREIVDLAKPLEGLVRNDSIHAAGVVIGDRPLVEYVPLQQNGADQEVVTQFGMWDVEALGLLKIDFLGLRNLDEDVRAGLRARHGPVPHLGTFNSSGRLSTIPLGDQDQNDDQAAQRRGA